MASVGVGEEKHLFGPREKGSGSKITTAALLRLINRQQFRCALSGRTLTPENAVADHVKPISRGGEHVIENIQILDAAVNMAKNTQTEEEFIAMCREVVAWADRVKDA